MEGENFDNVILRIIDTPDFTQYVQSHFIPKFNQTFEVDIEGSYNHEKRPDLTPWIVAKVDGLRNAELSKIVTAWLDKQLDQHITIVNSPMHDHLLDSNNFRAKPSEPEILKSPALSETSNRLPVKNSSVLGADATNKISSLDKLTTNRKLSVMENRLVDQHQSVTSTIGFGNPSGGVGKECSVSVGNTSHFISAKRKLTTSVIASRFESKQPISANIGFQHPVHQVVKNLAFLYSTKLIGDEAYLRNKHVVATSFMNERIPLVKFCGLLQKLVQISSNASVHAMDAIQQSVFRDVEWGSFLLVLVDILLPVVKSLGSDIIKMLMRCNAFEKFRHRSDLNDQLDANLISMDHENQEQFYSHLAESYIKPFAEEDNRNEQKSKDEKDLYKERGNISDLFLNLFNEYSSLMNDSDEIRKYWGSTFQNIGSAILAMNPRNMHWFARIFLGLFVHYCLDLKHTSYDAAHNQKDSECLDKKLTKTFSKSNTKDCSPNLISHKTKCNKKVSKGNVDDKKQLNSSSLPLLNDFEFTGILNFFSKFVTQFNNHLFNQCLSIVIIRELQGLASHQGANRISSLESITDGSNTAVSSISREVFDINSFTINVLTLKHLGKLFGIIHFHQYVVCPQLISHLDCSCLSSSLLLDLLVFGLQQRKLCQVVPWVCAYLKMTRPIKDNFQSLNSNEIFMGYWGVYYMLSSLPSHPDFDVWNGSSSTNKVFVIMEIEKLWEALPFVAVRVNAVRSLMHSTSNYYSVSKLIVEEALISNAQVHGVDDENFALIGISLSILNPELIFNIPTASSTESNLGLKRSSINGDTIINSIQLVSSTSNVEERINSKGEKTSVSAAIIPLSPLSATSKKSLRITPLCKKNNLPPTPNSKHAVLSADRLKSQATGFRLKSPLKLYSANITSELSTEWSVDSENNSVAKQLFGELSSDKIGQTPVQNIFTLLQNELSSKQELIDRMDDAFWNYNRDLCEVHKFLIYYLRLIGKDRIQEFVCKGIHTLNLRLDGSRQGNYVAIMQEVHTDVLKNGMLAISKLYDNAGQLLAPQLYALHSKSSSRTLQLACLKTRHQLQYQQHFLYLHLNEYASRKLHEVQESKLRKLSDHPRPAELNSNSTNKSIPTSEPVEDELRVEKLKKDIEKKLATLLSKGFLLRGEQNTGNGEILRDELQWIFSCCDFASSTILINKLCVVCDVLGSIASLTSALVLTSVDKHLADSHCSLLRGLLNAFNIFLGKVFEAVSSTEMLGRMKIEISKLLLQLFPHCSAIDLIFSTKVNYVVDYLAMFIKLNWITSDTILKIVVVAARDKSGAFYRQCQGLQNLNLQTAIFFFYARVLVIMGKSDLEITRDNYHLLTHNEIFHQGVRQHFGESHSDLLRSIATTVNGSVTAMGNDANSTRW